MIWISPMLSGWCRLVSRNGAAPIVAPQTGPSTPSLSPTPTAPHLTYKATEMSGIVVEVSQGLCRVSLTEGEPLLCEVRRSLKANDTGFTNIVAVGDEVLISRNGAEAAW